jgi:hypothetical protein
MTLSKMVIFVKKKGAQYLYVTRERRSGEYCQNIQNYLKLESWNILYPYFNLHIPKLLLTFTFLCFLTMEAVSTSETSIIFWDYMAQQPIRQSSSQETYLKVNTTVRVKGCIDEMTGDINMGERMKEVSQWWWIVHITVQLMHGLSVWLHHGCLYYQSCCEGYAAPRTMVTLMSSSWTPTINTHNVIQTREEKCTSLKWQILV